MMSPKVILPPVSGNNSWLSMPYFPVRYRLVAFASRKPHCFTHSSNRSFPILSHFSRPANLQGECSVIKPCGGFGNTCFPHGPCVR